MRQVGGGFDAQIAPSCPWLFIAARSCQPPSGPGRGGRPGIAWGAAPTGNASGLAADHPRKRRSSPIRLTSAPACRAWTAQTPAPTSTPSTTAPDAARHSRAAWPAPAHRTDRPAAAVGETRRRGCAGGRHPGPSAALKASASSGPSGPSLPGPWTGAPPTRHRAPTVGRAHRPAQHPALDGVAVRQGQRDPVTGPGGAGGRPASDRNTPMQTTAAQRPVHHR